jgi:hypothetical protein
MGSLMALEAAAQAPERAWHLALLATAAPMRVSDALLATAEQQPVKAMKMVNVFSHSSLAAAPGYPGPGGWLHGANQALMERTQAGWRGTTGRAICSCTTSGSATTTTARWPPPNGCAAR